ncbi:uncharacterized protein LOC115922854 [Strongylocentrotus purpuratus]|uniref:Uncharacterized protein n=1 Tax=Strongylocentrotus purpuratus TaxID=7668 RepID=A0A7M7NNZ8_STRPU|nr:uncharacterized protein LOC115922854 [Strongylocentrotus purpuratus]
MTPSQKSTLRICIAHPCNRYPAEMRRRQESLSEPFYQLATVIKFSLESKEDDLKLLCLSDSEKVQETVPVRGLLKGECNTLDFELMSSPDEGGAKSICLRIEQGTSTLAEQHMPTSIEGVSIVAYTKFRELYFAITVEGSSRYINLLTLYILLVFNVENK